MAVLSMSKQELSRLDVLLRVELGRLRVTDACVLIGLQRRQVFRLLRGLKQDGATSLLSKRRGRPSNHRLPAEVRALALSIVRERYSDFGAAGKLQHQCPIERRNRRELETVQALDRREPRLLDAAFDHPLFPVDQFELGQAQQITRVVDAFGSALLGKLVVFA